MDPKTAPPNEGMLLLAVWWWFTFTFIEGPLMILDALFLQIGQLFGGLDSGSQE